MYMIGRKIERGEIVRYKERERERKGCKREMQWLEHLADTDWSTMTQANSQFHHQINSPHRASGIENQVTAPFEAMSGRILNSLLKVRECCWAGSA